MATRKEGRVKSGPVSLASIEAAAIKLFSEKTYPVVGMRDISDAVGLLPGSLYVHISKKEDLLQRIVEDGIQRYLDAIEPVVESDQTAPERLRGAINAHMSVLAESLEQTRVAFHQWTYLAPTGKRRVVKLRRRYDALFSQIIDEGIEAGEFRAVKSARVTVLAIIGMLNSATEWFSPNGELTAEQIAEVLTDGVLTGLQA
ncbi:TetR/AcrR family transcriptional regulator [Nonomuraea sp. NPDC052116]|uniref:TetR/AcrR family transcriptional regulator n=1 Tax=Nonomuraea sp. NPDC052116 TaxID=3155665 RepID=UPI0034133ED3